MSRNNQLDSLRGLASILVVIYHFNLIMETHVKTFSLWGFLGVKIFFIISGFLLVGSFARNLELSGKIGGLKQYGLNRFWRIVPAYYINLLFVTALFFMLNTDLNWIYSAGFLSQVVQHLLFIPFFIIKDVGYGMNGSYWTLCIEMIWYLLVPVIYYYASSVKRIAVLTGLSFIYFVLLQIGALDYIVNLFRNESAPIQGTRVWVSLQIPGQFMYFGIGILLWKFKDKLLGFIPSKRTSWILFVGAFLLIYITSFFDSLNFILLNFQYAIFATLVFLMIYLASKTNVKVLAWFGTISYSLYLWNFPLLIIFKKTHVLDHMPTPVFVLLFAATLIVISAGSYYFVEHGAIRRKNQSHQKEKITQAA